MRDPSRLLDYGSGIAPPIAALTLFIGLWAGSTRSFMYIDDCLKGTHLVMNSDFTEPLNLGSDQLVTINRLVDIVESIAGRKLRRRYNLNAPKGVRGRNSDNTLIKSVLDWAPGITLEDGIEKTYRWIYDRMTMDNRRYA